MKQLTQEQMTIAQKIGTLSRRRGKSKIYFYHSTTRIAEILERYKDNSPIESIELLHDCKIWVDCRTGQFDSNGPLAYEQNLIINSVVEEIEKYIEPKKNGVLYVFRIQELHDSTKRLMAKQKWARKELQNFLGQWKNTTLDDLNDDSLTYLKLCAKTVSTDEGEKRYLIKRGSPELMSYETRTGIEPNMNFPVEDVNKIGMVDIYAILSSLNVELAFYIFNINERTKKSEQDIRNLDKFGCC